MAELSKAFEAASLESKWYQFWEENGLFRADVESKKPPFCIVLPPPNVTGVLHIGHALNGTLQDILIRWKRMEGFEALWVPGTDHASIATHAVVERHLFKTHGKRRHDYTRQEFIAHAWEWKDKSEKEIVRQLRTMGFSCDWSRLQFTMDAQNSRSVRLMFKKLYDEGLIYRGDYLVNWDPVTETALADDEVEYEERTGSLWHIAYPLENGAGFIVVATTRPETMLGDTAIGVHPSDKRYAHLIGKNAIVPIDARLIPIIADECVDPKFGTGAVKITPAHDHLDYQLGLKHKLPFINILTSSGKINENGGKFQGMTAEEARGKVLEELKVKKALLKTESHTHRVGVSYRSKVVIEPYLSKQWFVKMSAFKEWLHEVVETDTVKIIPPEWKSTYFHWIDHLRDWCISRQLWWGHQIPIWYHKKSDKIICYDGEDVPEEVKLHPDEWGQDPDILDTWFSSALWPFSTLGWPEKDGDMKKFFPTSVLITGHDILFFWVARMLMMSYAALKEPPFRDVFLNGIIYGKCYWRQDKEGRPLYADSHEQKEYDLGLKALPKDVFCKWEKMSKSKGNVIDPLEIVKDYGTDATRLALASCASTNRQIDLDRRRFEEFKNFINKVWNGARFVFLNLDGLSCDDLGAGLDIKLLSLEDKWLLSKLSSCVTTTKEGLSSYDFAKATDAPYNFFWNQFCSYYLEMIKPVLSGSNALEKKTKQKILLIVLLQSIRLLHPMAPFITEELFSHLKQQFGAAKATKDSDPYTVDAIDALHSVACMTAPYPKPFQKPDLRIEKDFDLISKFIAQARTIRGEMNLAPGAMIDLYIWSKEDDASLELLKKESRLLTALVKAKGLKSSKNAPPEASHSGSSAHIEGISLFIPLPQELMEQEKERLKKEEKRLFEQIERTEKLLATPSYCEKAPLAVVEKTKDGLAKLEKEHHSIKEQLKKM